MKVKSESGVAQSCPTLSDPMDYSLPGSFIHGIFQARELEWVAIAFSDIARQKQLLLRQKQIAREFCLMYLFMSVWNSTYHAEANIQWFTQHKSVIIVEKKSEDLIYSSCPSFIVWSWAHQSSFLKLSFLICETTDSTRRMLRNFRFWNVVIMILMTIKTMLMNPKCVQ